MEDGLQGDESPVSADASLPLAAETEAAGSWAEQERKGNGLHPIQP